MRRGAPLGTVDAEALRIVEACLELDRPMRDAFIARHCAGSSELTRKIQRMLAINDATLPETELFAPPSDAPEIVPDRIGKFRVIDIVGRGGMGTVARAERDDGLFGQTVAIKLLRSDMRGARARDHFDNERRLLARLDHPSIARILDGGEEAGRPYLVMEFVEGALLLDDLARNGADPRERLGAFLQVADAVSYAHRKLVIHGDIKPANVVRNAEGHVKLLDFGIGRLIEQLTEDGDRGAPAHYPLTPTYAAPERLSGEPPTIAGDVFGLGMLLHELLTGRAGAPDAPPMSRLDSGLATLSARQLRGDLDAIVARALAADPAERYPDASTLAADVRRHLTMQPVSARQHRWRYVAGRFVARNRLAVAAGSTIVVLLALATAISMLLYLDAHRQRATAEARFEDVRSLAKFQLFTLYPQLAALPGTLATRARLSEETQAYLDRLAALPQASDAVRIETAAGYNRLAEIQGVPNRPNLGRAADALQNLQRAEAILAPLLAARPTDTMVAAELAWTRLYRADLAIWHANAVAQGERILATAEPLVARTRADSSAWRRLENFRRSVRLDVLGWTERYDAERAFASETLDWLAALPPAEREAPAYVIARAEAHNARGEADFYSGRAHRSLEDARAGDRLIRAARARHPNDPALLSARVVSLYNLITTMEPLGLRAGLLPMTMELTQLGRRSVAFEPNDALIAWRARNAEAVLAQLLGEADRHREAIAIQSGIVDRDRQKLAATPGDTRLRRDLGFSTQILAGLHWKAGERDAACARWSEADGLFTRLERQGTLNDWDRTRVVAPMRHSYRACNRLTAARDGTAATSGLSRPHRAA